MVSNAKLIIRNTGARGVNSLTDYYLSADGRLLDFNFDGATWWLVKQ
jgi:hypothetical protein